MKTYLEYRDEKSSKFWEVTVVDTTMTTRWGKLGSDGQSKEKSFLSNDVAITEAEKLVGQKARKGYAPLDEQISTPTEPQSDKPTLLETMKENLTNFEVLRDRWLLKTFSSSISNDQFKVILNQLLEDTLKNSKNYSPKVRAEIVSNMLQFDVSYEFNGYFHKEDIKNAQELIFSGIIEVLKQGFDGEEVTVDLLGYAPYDLEVLEAILQAGVNPNSKFQSGIDCFTYEGGKYKLFDRLVEAGANLELLVDGKIRNGLLYYRYLNIIHKKGVNLNVIDEEGKTPFFHCEYIGGRVKTFSLLKKSGCDIDQLDHAGETALSTNLKEVADLNSTWKLREVCKGLIRAGASVNCPPNPVPLLFRLPTDISPGTCLTEEVLGFIDLLIKKKVSLEEKDPVTGNTALHYWVVKESSISRTYCEKLIKKGAAIDSLNSNGQTPLMYAAQQHAKKSWKLLLSKKSDINARSANGYSVSEWAVARGEEPPQSFLKLLLESNAPLEGSDADTDLSLLGFLIQNNHYHSALIVVEHGGEITDWVIDTMFKQSPEGQEDALEDIIAFIRVVGKRAQEALNTRYQGEIEKLLSEVPKATFDDPLEVLSPKYWPPIFPQRQPLVVLDVVGKELESKVIFEDGEIKEYLNVDRDYVNHNVSYSKDDKEILERIDDPNRNKRVPFYEYSEISDKAMAYSWNENIARNQEVLARMCLWGGEGNISANEYKYLLARCGALVIPSFLEIAKKKTIVMIRVMQPVADVRLASIMAMHLYRTPASRAVRKWLLRHTDHAIHGLIPLSVGKLGKQRDACEAALRYMAYQGLKDEIVEAAEGYGDEVLGCVQEILSVDHVVDYHLNGLPEVPTQIIGADIPLPIVLGTKNPLGQECLRALYGMMSLSSYDDPYPPLKIILPLLDVDSLSVFSWEIFLVWDNWVTRWDDKEKILKKEAEWMCHCLAYMGNDTTVKKLTPYINSWPKSGGMNKAITGLDILANIGSDFAIRSINKILLKTKYKPLQKRAGDIMDIVADVRGLTKAELDDRLVPTFGLDDPSAFVLDYGTRKFTIKITEKLVSELYDPDNNKIKNLPKPAKADDEAKAKEATKFWKSLKSDLRTVASTQLLRFEQAMLSGQQWRADDFSSLLVAHPVLGPLVRHLVWGECRDGKTVQLFRVDIDGTYIDAKGKDVSLTDGAMVCIPHPLYIQKSLEHWKDALVKNKLSQPFAQIGRELFLKKDDKGKDLFGINGAKAPDKALRGLNAKGWVPEIGGGGAIWSYEKNLSDGTVHIDFERIVNSHDYGLDKDQALEVTISGKVTPLEYSEVVREIKNLLH